jgi:uncharacterized protein involved in exopolysaccharide biosynthesis
LAQPVTTQTEPRYGISMMDALAAILHYRRLVLTSGLTLAIPVAAFVLLQPRTYTAGASFTPQVTRSALGGLGSLAAQFGVTVPTTDGNQSPAFYSDLLRSRTVLEPVVRMPVHFAWKGKEYSGTFVELSKVRGADSLQRLESAIRALHAAMSVSVAIRTGIVRVETTTRFPQLSVMLTDSAIGLLNSFNVETRRSQASAQRQFLEERLATVSRELQDAEDAVRDFSKRNRGDLRSSPELLLQQERLNRAVSLRVQVYGGLAQALEQAKLDEIRDTPLITIIERADQPVRPDPRGLILSTMIALLAGIFLGAVVALLRHAVAVNRRERPESFAEISADAAAAKADLMRLLGPFRRTPKDQRTV